MAPRKSFLSALIPQDEDGNVTAETQANYLDAGVNVAGNIIGAAGAGKYQRGAARGKAIGSGVGALAGSFLGVPQVGAALGGTVGGLFGGKSDQNLLTHDQEQEQQTATFRQSIDPNENPYGTYAEGGSIIDPPRGARANILRRAMDSSRPDNTRIDPRAPLTIASGIENEGRTTSQIAADKAAPWMATANQLNKLTSDHDGLYNALYNQAAQEGWPKSRLDAEMGTQLGPIRAQIDSLRSTLPAHYMHGGMVMMKDPKMMKMMNYPEHIMKRYAEGGQVDPGPGDPKPLRPEQRSDWNSFIGYVKQQGHSGNPKLDHDPDLRKQLFDGYRKLNPTSTLDESVVPNVQAELQSLRTNTQGLLERKGTPNPNVMNNISKYDGIFGQRTSTSSYPSAMLVQQNNGKQVSSTDLGPVDANIQAAKMTPGAKTPPAGTPTFQTQSGTMFEGTDGDLHPAKQMAEGGRVIDWNEGIMKATPKDLTETILYYGEGGKIHINPAHKGKFTAWASSHGMSVGEAAKHVMANKDKYSGGVVKMANFAKNFGKYAEGGMPDMMDQQFQGQDQGQDQGQPQSQGQEQQQQAPQPTTINVEKGELLSDKDGKIINEFSNPNRFSPHGASKFKEPTGNFVQVDPGNIVIPKKDASRFKEGDIITRKSILRRLVDQQVQDPGINDPNRPQGSQPAPQGGGQQSGGGSLQFAEGGLDTPDYPRTIPNPLVNNPTRTNITGIHPLDDIPLGGQSSVDASTLDPSRANIVDESAASPAARTVSSGTGVSRLDPGMLARTVEGKLPGIYQSILASKGDPFLKPVYNQGYDRAKSDIMQSPERLNVDDQLQAANESEAAAVQGVRGANSPSSRAELSVLQAQADRTKSGVLANRQREETGLRTNKLRELAGLQEQQGASDQGENVRVQGERRMDKATRENIQASVLDQNYRLDAGQHSDMEKIKAINHMSHFEDVDPWAIERYKNDPEAREYIYNSIMSGGSIKDGIASYNNSKTTRSTDVIKTKVKTGPYGQPKSRETDRTSIQKH